MKRTEKPGLVVGIAGIMGAGKSTVAKVFEELGAKVIDADLIGKQILREAKIKHAILEAFGEGVKASDGEIDASRLGFAAFEKEEYASELDRITRDRLIARIKARIDKVREGADIIVVDAALLPEWNCKTWVDVLIVVDSCEEDAVRRSCYASRFKPASVRARMRHQFSRKEKSGRADIVIPNYGSLEMLRERAERVFWTLMGVTRKG